MTTITTSPTSPDVFSGTPTEPTATTTTTTTTTSGTPGSTDTSGPAATVTSYYAAINQGDYQTAWNLGGKNLDPSYSDFVSGFNGPVQDTVNVVSVQGDIVNVDITSQESDGSTHTFSGTYTVVNGVITASNIAQTS